MSFKYDIIFDLDGTLWNTKASYLYAYKKALQKHPEIKTKFSDDLVLNTMGYTLDIVAKRLFFEVEDKVQIMKECLMDSCYYLINNESTINEEFIKTITELKNNCRFFIVSNCPKEYFDVFFLKLNDNSLFTDYRYLTSTCDKVKNIENLKTEYAIKDALIVGDSYIDYDAALKTNMLFGYYNKGYHLSDNFDYLINDPCDLISIINFNIKKDHILKDATYKKTFHIKNSELTIFKNDNWNQDKYGFGFIKNNGNFEELILKMLENLKSQGIKEIIGPIDYATWYQYRFQVDNFDLSFLPDINNSKEEVEVLKKYGFNEKYHYSSTLSTIDKNLWNYASRVKLDPKYHLEVYHDEACYEHLKEIYDISTDCFKEAILYTPITYDDFKQIYVKNLKVINPDLVIIYAETEAVAFSLSYPDLKNNIYVSKTVGIKKNHQNSTLIMKLIDASYKSMADKGYEKVLFHFQNDEKPTLRKVYRHNIILQKHYAVFSKKYENNNV